jgi:alpha-ketoglutarate-dependent taurine dioxygenase
VRATPVAPRWPFLAAVPVRYEYESPDALLAAETPVIRLDRDGTPLGLRFNNRSKRVPLAPVDLVRAWYDAYGAFAGALEEEAALVEVRLEPGDLVCFDNERVLHGRRAFAGGERWLQGCYTERDGLRSKVALLRRAEREVAWAPA